MNSSLTFDLPLNPHISTKNYVSYLQNTPLHPTAKVSCQYIDQQIHQQMIQLKACKCEGFFVKFYLKQYLPHHNSNTILPIPPISPFICSIQSNIEYTAYLIK